jgi:hypothetical protein
MAFLRPAFFLIIFLFLLSVPVCPAQNVSNDDLFTLAVAEPTLAKDVQVRYLFAGEFGGYQASFAESAAGNKIHITAGIGAVDGVNRQSAKSLKLIAYAPGCQFVTLTVDDLGSTRQGDFQCQHLPTLQLRGRVDILDFGQQQLQVEALYDFRWAMSFFGIMDGAVSPLTLGKATVASDGTFTMEVPDFVADPSWPRLSGDAGLMFALSDAKTGRRLAILTSLSDLTHNGGVVPVAASYPELAFAVRILR